MPKKILPPHWASRFLEWYCRPQLYEDLQGDLNEYFQRNLIAKGLAMARFIYVLDVLKFLRFYTIRTPKFINLLIHWIMIGSYFKTSSRSILRYKLFSTINIIGLAVSMSVGLLMIVFISDLTSYDNFHEKKDRIYRITTRDVNNVDLASTSVLAGRLIKESFPGLENITLLRRGFGGDAFTGEKTLPVGGLWADASFLSIFSFPLLHGNATTALKDPYSIVLTESTAERLFGTTDVVGRHLIFDSTQYLVTGVLENIPRLTHLRFETLVSFSTVELANPEMDGDFLSWGSVYMNHVYVLLPDRIRVKSLRASLDRISAEQNVNHARPIALGVQPLTKIALGKQLENQLGPKLPNLATGILLGLTAIVILSACFNYTNLSIARSLRRSREVGVRKVIGATKAHIVNQFVVESVMIALMALVFSFVLFVLLRAQFLSLHPFVSSLVSLDLSPTRIVYFIIFALIVGITAGLLPALFYSKVNTITVLKNVPSLALFKHLSLRKSLIVVQYVFSLVFITTTVLGYKQYKDFIAYDLGFNTENIVNIFLQGNKADVLVKELSEIPEVSGVSQSLLVMSLGRNYNTIAKYGNEPDSSNVWVNFVDEHYLPLHEHEFIIGQNFSPKPLSADESEIVVNEQFLRRFNIGMGDPSKALGEVITVENKKLAIVGVVKDFHYETIEDKIQPMVFRYFTNADYGYVNVKVSTNDWFGVMQSIEKAWGKIDKVHALDAQFYDDQIKHAYSQFSMMIKVIGFLAFLAVCIASMGLFGMVVFSTETRLREVSIRKVFGADEWRLVLLLSRGFIYLLAIAALIALPVTYISFEKVVLSNFAYHAPIQLIELAPGLLGVVMIAVLMLVTQTVKVARSNPAEVLKNE
jgi:ABC-type antimicrobial peptide transport system permease subunit